MSVRKTVKDDDRGYADRTDSSRWDIRQEQQATRDKERKTKGEKLLAGMSNRFRKMRDGPD